MRALGATQGFKNGSDMIKSGSHGENGLQGERIRQGEQHGAVAKVIRRLDPSQLPAQPSTVSGHVMEEGKDVDGFRRYLKYKTVNE